MICNEVARESEQMIPFWLDGFDGQEDELDDVRRGKLEPSTDDEPEAEVFEPNKGNLELEREDEEAGVPSQADVAEELKDFPGFR